MNTWLNAGTISDRTGIPRDEVHAAMLRGELGEAAKRDLPVTGPCALEADVNAWLARRGQLSDAIDPDAAPETDDTFDRALEKAAKQLKIPVEQIRAESRR